LAETRFDPVEFDSRLATRLFGRRLITLTEVGSTNDAAWEAWSRGATSGTAVVAEAQLAGRGRGGRIWHMAPGRGLALSLLVEPHPNPGAGGVIALLAGLATVRALERFGVDAGLKWPNDVVLGGRKLSGILCEARSAAVVIGLGVNVSGSDRDFPPDLAGSATTLEGAGFEVRREALAAEFLNALEPLAEALAERGARPGLDAWQERARFFGRPVEARTPAGVVRGIARRLDDDGALVVRLESGAESRVVAGDLEIPEAAAAATLRGAPPPRSRE